MSRLTMAHGQERGNNRMKPVLTIRHLIKEAEVFCDFMSKENHPKLLGVTDGKRVGTYIEHRFQGYLSEKYIVTVGNSAEGINLPDDHIEQ